MNSNKNEKGFSLVELLVVVIIIAIVAAIAIPNLLASRRAANEASAISALRTIHSAEITYFSTSGGNSDYGTMADLGTVGLIDGTLAAATTSAAAKSGYFYTASLIASTSDGYCTTATPASTTQGTRIFAVSTPGVIFTSAANGSSPPTCTAGVITGTTAIQ
jgi:type IV pilus assembly protein PilA